MYFTGGIRSTYRELKEIYYLQSIQTASHRAIFIRDIRLDEHSTDGTNSSSVLPQLKVTKIMLIKNEDLYSLISTSHGPASTAFGDMSGALDLDSTSNSGGYWYTEDWYQTHHSSIDPFVMRLVDFSQNYSLCKKYYNNLNIHCPDVTNEDSPSEVNGKITVTSGQTSNSGKLTLNEIKFYELQKADITPSYVFTYTPNENPDYNPMKVDYWGYYKYDVTSGLGLGYSGYTTKTSKDHTKVWSLTKVLLPSGGSINVEYESNQYGTVVSDPITQTDIKGPTRIFMINGVEDVSGHLGSEWDVSLEDPDANEFRQLVSSTPSATEKIAVIPFEYGWLCMGDNTSVDLGISRVSDLSAYVLDGYGTYQPYASTLSLSDFEDIDGSRYSGNGYLLFRLPLGSQVYGGGIRVRRLSMDNCSIDSYVKEYSYAGGAVISEPDRFAVLKKTNDNPKYFPKLVGPTNDGHILGSGVGYSKVIERNLGETEVDNGSIEYSFVTAPFVTGPGVVNDGVMNYKPFIKDFIYTHTVDCNTGEGTYTLADTSTIIDVSENISSMWGAPKETRIIDAHGNIIKKTVNKYDTNTPRGCITETFDFYAAIDFLHPTELPTIHDECVMEKHKICVLRSYKPYLSEVTEYGKGFASTTHIDEYNRVTGSAMITRISDSNGQEAIKYNAPCFMQCAYTEMASKAVDQSNLNLLGYNVSLR